MAVAEKSRKFCTHCGQTLLNKSGTKNANELYDEDLFQKSKILRLLDCRRCGVTLADKYVECDGALILIDLMLHNPLVRYNCYVCIHVKAQFSFYSMIVIISLNFRHIVMFF